MCTRCGRRSRQAAGRCAHRLAAAGNVRRCEAHAPAVGGDAARRIPATVQVLGPPIHGMTATSCL